MVRELGHSQMVSRQGEEEVLPEPQVERGLAERGPGHLLLGPGAGRAGARDEGLGETAGGEDHAGGFVSKQVCTA